MTFGNFTHIVRGVMQHFSLVGRDLLCAFSHTGLVLPVVKKLNILEKEIKT